MRLDLKNIEFIRPKMALSTQILSQYTKYLKKIIK